MAESLMTSGYSIIFFIKSFSIELISTFFISILVLFFLIRDLILAYV